jgi:ACS family D-galactonate transporter-like MFS transporter
MPKIPRRRWRIAFLLAAGVLVNYFDRVNLSVAHAALITTFAISNITFGYLSAAYNWTYALCQLPVGVVLDKFGVRRVGRISSFLWSVASFAAAITPNLGGFFAARLLLGIGEAPTFPSNAKAIGYWFPAKERSSATSIFDGSAKFASAIGVPLIGMLLLRVGWRWSFAATGLISFLYFLLFCYVYRDPVDDPGLTEQERDYILERDTEAPVLPAETASLGYLIRQPKVIGMTLGFGAYNYVFYLLLTWLPSYLSQALHIDLLHSFLYTGVPWLFGTACELVVGGWLVDWLLERGWNASSVQRSVLIGGTAMGLGIIGAAYAQTATSALIWISISPRGSVGTLGGIINFSSQVSGILAPIVTGYLVSARHSFGWAFGVSAIYLCIGISAYIFLLGRIERIPSQPQRAA